tara:strand:- start:3760 stop:4179 length:420 start_codon:yes stop_codon:yes gene_type:complete
MIITIDLCNIIYTQNILYINVNDTILETNKIDELLTSLDKIFEKIYTEKKQIYVIHNVSNLSYKNALMYNLYIHHFLQFLNKNKYLFEECLLSTFIIIENNIIKNIFKLLLKLYNNVKPIMFFNNEKETLEYLKINCNL